MYPDDRQSTPTISSLVPPGWAITCEEAQPQEGFAVVSCYQGFGFELQGDELLTRVDVGSSISD